LTGLPGGYDTGRTPPAGNGKKTVVPASRGVTGQWFSVRAIVNRKSPIALAVGCKPQAVIVLLFTCSFSIRSTGPSALSRDAERRVN